MNAVYSVSSSEARPSQEHWPNQTLIDDLCMILFDRWCERRCVLPLVYLMHGWPITTRTFRVLQHLSDTFKDLETFHAETLASEERQILSEVIGLMSHALSLASDLDGDFYDQMSKQFSTVTD